jgi:hypothetical protein
VIDADASCPSNSKIPLLASFNRARKKAAQQPFVEVRLWPSAASQIFIFNGGYGHDAEVHERPVVGSELYWPKGGGLVMISTLTIYRTTDSIKGSCLKTVS